MDPDGTDPTPVRGAPAEPGSDGWTDDDLTMAVKSGNPEAYADVIRVLSRRIAAEPGRVYDPRSVIAALGAATGLVAASLLSPAPPRPAAPVDLNARRRPGARTKAEKTMADPGFAGWGVPH